MPLGLRLFATLAVTALYALIMFALAGRWNVPEFWAYLAVIAIVGLVRSAVTPPELMRERMHPGGGARDTGLLVVLAVSFCAQFVLALLDAGRFHWSDTVPWPLRILGLVLVLLGGLLFDWALAVNRFFSTVVRLQSERGHYVVKQGPYHWVRHPGYAGALFYLPATSLALNSWLSLIPGLLALAVLVRRTVLEDRMLTAELPGYAAYTEEVPYRLLPGLW